MFKQPGKRYLKRDGLVYIVFYRVTRKTPQIQQAVMHHVLNITIYFLNGKKEMLFSFRMILFLYPNNMN